MQRVKVELYGKDGHRKTEIKRDDRFQNPRFGRVATQPTESITITQDLPTPAELTAKALIRFNNAWTANRSRAIQYLSEDLDISEGVILSEFATAVETQYAPRTAITPAQWCSLARDLNAVRYFNVVWMRSLKMRISRKYEDRRIAKPDLKALLSELNTVMGVQSDDV